MDQAYTEKVKEIVRDLQLAIELQATHEYLTRNELRTPPAHRYLLPHADDARIHWDNLREDLMTAHRESLSTLTRLGG